MPLCKASRQVAAIDLNGQGGSGEPPLPRLPRSRLQFCGFDVHQYVGDTRIALLDCSFYTVRDFVAFVHRNIAIDSCVEIDVEIQSHLSGAAFLNLDNTRHRAGDAANGSHNFSPRRRVHDLMERRQRQTNAVRGDYRAGEQCCPVIRAIPGFATEKCSRDSDERGGRSERITAVMPRVRFDRRALGLSAEAIYVPKEEFL